MNIISFNHSNFGKCEVICLYKDTAIIELKNNGIEKYAVVIELSLQDKCWSYGYYCKTLKEASEVFNNILEYFYMAIFKI